MSFPATRLSVVERTRSGDEITLVPLDFQTAEGEMARHEGSVDAAGDDFLYRELRVYRRYELPILVLLVMTGI